MISKYPLITLGSPYGIGYEIFLMSLEKSGMYSGHVPFCIGSGTVMRFFMELTGIKAGFKAMKRNGLHEGIRLSSDERFVLIDIDGADDRLSVTKPSDMTGSVDGNIAYRSIDIAADLVRGGFFGSITTLPVSKKNINLVDNAFKGHTEFFQKKWDEKKVFMTFISDKLNVMLLSTHIPLKEVPSYVTPEIVKEGIKTAIDLKTKLGLKKKICLLGMNPHAGENGLLGDEDILMKNAADSVDNGNQVEGPIPADTAFTSFNLEKFGLFISAYHDQGLIPFKMLAFDDGVNLSYGMKHIRTSVDHGTGVDLIGKKRAKIDSFINAYNLAIRLS
jgi:4-hydroxythreonine-4-phosphate dehydrogenase